MKDFTDNNAMVSKAIIGQTYQGLDIPMLKIGNNTSPIVLIIGGHHARELISVTQALYITNLILEDPLLTKNRQFFVIPLLNIDSYRKID